jgi:hypothetical protein
LHYASPEVEMRAQQMPLDESPYYLRMEEPVT